MKPSILKAILLSALVFPGAGQLYLKRFKTGLVLLAVTLIGFFTMVASVMNTAMSALQQIQVQGDIVNITQITRIATDSTTQSSNSSYTLSLSLIVIWWLYSIADAYFAATKANRSSR